MIEIETIESTENIEENDEKLTIYRPYSREENIINQGQFVLFNADAPNPNLSQGSKVPKSYGEFPTHLACIPLAEIDPYYFNKSTFIVISKWGTISRFSADPTCFLCSPFSPIRRIAIYIFASLFFNLLVSLTVLCHGFFLLIDGSEYTNACRILFTMIYTFELIIKLTARGFFLGRFTYLLFAWNWLELLLVLTSYVEIVIVIEVTSRYVIFRALGILAMKIALPLFLFLTSFSNLLQLLRKWWTICLCYHAQQRKIEAILQIVILHFAQIDMIV